MTELEGKMYFMHQVMWHPCLPDGAQILINAKLGNISKEHKKFLSWLKPFLRYGGHKFTTFSCSVGNTVGPIDLKF
ncbi:hypothetical protein O3M35_008569 [Rhynocoris fuscipes]|uniref:Uncharacterized protein n=1 Tax=Rhynocoris fuscipes TaxID=488301 RepID=A0AAW1D806_9HEMI